MTPPKKIPPHPEGKIKGHEISPTFSSFVIYLITRLVSLTVVRPFAVPNIFQIRHMYQYHKKSNWACTDFSIPYLFCSPVVRKFGNSSVRSRKSIRNLQPLEKYACACACTVRIWTVVEVTTYFQTKQT